ncbi:hypothetical protein MPSEU_000187400 [Mayamaea pseudoterrestris]|nr:hypothetical protein MPSEU_000187400 [Mayamaea pseudoterrestris]
MRFSPRSLQVANQSSLVLRKNVSIINNFLQTELLLEPECEGKERLLGILHRAGKRDLSLSDCEMLPTWQQVTDLYGDKPIIRGLETCQAYRDSLQGREPDPRVAGLFNTGTNAFVELLQLNFEMKDRHDYTAPNGKHTSLKYKNWSNSPRNETGDHVDAFVIALIRDPFRWMKSMCKSHYKARWLKGLDRRCPNLVPNSDESKMNRLRNAATFRVTLNRTFYMEEYDSLADMWSEWYKLYVNATFPRLIIRFEDTLFHADQVMESIMDCIGRPLQKRVRNHLDASKHHGKSTDFLEALAKYGRADGRDAGLQAQDRVYAQTALDQEVMRMFHYPQVAVAESAKEMLSLAANASDETQVN